MTNKVVYINPGKKAIRSNTGSIARPCKHSKYGEIRWNTTKYYQHRIFCS